MGGVDRSADPDPLGRCAARRAPEGNQGPGDPRLAHHDVDKGEELDRHAEFADCDVPAADPAALRGIPSADGRTREGSRSRARAKDAAAEALRRELEAAGISADGLVELIDIAERLPPVPIKAKLAEVDVDSRNLRVFETGDPAVLMVLEKADAERREYGIERDEGLVSDLRLFARARELT